MVAIIAGLLVFAGIALVIGSKPVQADATITQAGACPYADSGVEGCPYAGQGGCIQGSNCGLNTCAAKYGGSCGCGGQR